MAKVETKEPTVTAAEKAMTRVGRCVVCVCEAFEFERVLDGFRTCLCQHTQHGHHFGEQGT